MIRRRALLALPLASAGLARPALARPAGGVLGRVLARGTLRAGVWLESGPYGHRTPEGEPAGMEVEVARDIARSLGVTIELVPLALSERFPAIILGHVDIACALMLVTVERLRRVAFAQPHGRFATVLVSLANRPVANLSELSGRRVALLSGAMLGGLTRMPNDIERVFAQSNQEALDWLRQGEVAGIVMARTAFRALSLAQPAEPFIALAEVSEVPYAVALPQGEPDMLRFLNTWVFLREEDGTLATLHETFLSAPRPPVARL